MNNMNQDKGMQKRMLVMTLIVFVFFIAYEFLVLKPKQEEKLKQQEIAKQESKNEAPKVAIETNGVPITAQPSSSAEKAKSISALSSKSVGSSNIITTIKTSKNIIQIDKLGRVAQVTLLENKYKDEEGNSFKLFEVDQLRPLEVRFANTDINNEAFEVDYISTVSSVDATKVAQKFTLTQKLSGLTLLKNFTVYPDGHYDLEVNTTSSKEQFFITNGFRPNILADMYADHGSMIKLNSGVTELTVDEDLSNIKSYTGVQFVSNFDRYYATVIYNFNQSLQVSLMPDKDNNPQGFVHANQSISFSGYMGPKNFKVLSSLNEGLTDVIEYGFFTFLAKPMFLLLQFLQSYIGNWGWTIVFLTILIKLVLYPLSYKGMVSMQKLKDLAPKMKEIQAKYKDDKQKQSMHMMELYKKHGANPMGGCLPLILQIPIFFAIYRVLLNSIELKGAEWILWINDLAEMDPLFVLPILMGASMWLQQKITPNTMQDEMQKKIFQMLPIVFTFFFLWFPAGLTLYWFVNNVFTISQQYYINRLFEKQRAAKK